MADETKTFTQDDLNEIVEKRLARDRKEDRERIMALEAEKTSLNSKLSEKDNVVKELSTKVETVATEAKQTLTEVLTGLVDSIPEENRTLIPDKYSEADKIKFIQQNKTKLFGQTPQSTETQPVTQAKPQTPASPLETAKTGTGQVTIPIGYKNLNEWALKDPKGFREAESKGLI